MNDPQQAIDQLGLTLPESVPLGGLYKRLVISGNQGYISGHGPYLGGGNYITGRLGEDMDLEAGQAAARQTGLDRKHLRTFNSIMWCLSFKFPQDINILRE